MPELPEPKGRRPKHRPENLRRYTGRGKAGWREFSKRYRKEHALCEVWLMFGRHVKCGAVDHLIPLELGGAYKDRRNLMSMATFWHNRKQEWEREMDVEVIETRGGLIPKNRNDILREFDKRYRKFVEKNFG